MRRKVECSEAGNYLPLWRVLFMTGNCDDVRWRSGKENKTSYTPIFVNIGGSSQSIFFLANGS
jgi:hypothetical protein